jgi:hypothetical protein
MIVAKEKKRRKEVVEGRNGCVRGGRRGHRVYEGMEGMEGLEVGFRPCGSQK